MNRLSLTGIAQETVRFFETGSYLSSGGRLVPLAADLQECISGTRYYTPESLDVLRAELTATPFEAIKTKVEIVRETTLEAAARLSADGKGDHLGVLNFASAKNPGGGFLGGSKAQEESLARSSGLYASLRSCPEYYGFHRAQRSCLYSDRMIYSPRCPVFRTDDGNLLEEPYKVDFITSPAPNAGAVRKNTPDDTGKIPEVLRARCGKLLILAIHHACDPLVLGAWGCGAFRNDPAMVADVFHQHLGPDGAFNGRFRRVTFAILDHSPDSAIYGPFEQRVRRDQ